MVIKLLFCLLTVLTVGKACTCNTSKALTEAYNWIEISDSIYKVQVGFWEGSNVLDELNKLRKDHKVVSHLNHFAFTNDTVLFLEYTDEIKTVIPPTQHLWIKGRRDETFLTYCINGANTITIGNIINDNLSNRVKDYFCEEWMVDSLLHYKKDDSVFDTPFCQMATRVILKPHGRYIIDCFSFENFVLNTFFERIEGTDKYTEKRSYDDNVI